MQNGLMRGLWSAGVPAGLAAGVPAAASTPSAGLAQQENACYRCECDEVLGCVCSLIACPEGEP